MRSRYFHFRIAAVALFLSSLIIPTFCRAESSARIPKAEGAVAIDGIIQESAWETALIFSKFYEIDPGDNTEPSVRTIAYLTYDHDNFYMAFRCFDPDPKMIRARYSDRDQASPDDQVGIILDPFNDQRFAVEFFVNPLGVQADLTRSEPGEEDNSWDTIWSSAGRITQEGYEVEVAIPFKSLRFSDTDVQTWRFLLLRIYPRNFRYQLSSIPLDRGRNCLLCQCETYTGMEGVKPGRNIEIVPSLFASESKVLEERSDFDADVGLSTTWGITPNHTLNAAINPDFSQVEADALQIDVNTRFALFYPEKRPFFLEGQSYFDTIFNVFYSRMIEDPSWGLKFTGKEDKNAYAALIAQDERATLLIPSNQSSDLFIWEHDVFDGAFRYRRDTGKDSTIGFLFTGRQADDYKSYLFGADGRIRLAKNDFLNFQILNSTTIYPFLPEVSAHFDGSEKQGGAYYVDYVHSDRNWEYGGLYRSKHPEFRADLGFIPRVDDTNYGVWATYMFYGDGKHFFNKLRPNVYIEKTTDHDHKTTDWDGGIEFYFDLPRQVTGELYYERAMELYNGSKYHKSTYLVWVNSRFSKAMTAYVRYRGGEKVDYVNERLGSLSGPGLQFDIRFGRHLFVDVNASQEKLSVDDGMIYKASICYMKWIYHINSNIFFRATIQLEDIKRNPALYIIPVNRSERLSTNQFLFTYKINPFTLLYLGYSDSGIEEDNIDRITLQKTYFLKLSYAFRP